ncbi:MarR family transcriptional regulator [Streptomyces sp. P9-2B-2]|uniref:MarR family winged helix-turn-helix transcriptional regulator n=1 Tax=Streptomyces TaxID=1883 RepID=UPI002001E485|nr:MULTISPECIES: MarR family transcriptional regulator [Streptomyces]MCX4639449.1 MarR family transcriptional regulator [Streptomyces platensis]WJY39441.1 MarR family transcriptional regulator [Streptomyces sp. P9-2B-2]
MTQQTRETRETPETAVPQSAADAPACPPAEPPGLAQGWCALSALHGRIESHIERALQATHDLSVREFSVLNVLSEQHDGPGGHLRMNQVADSVVLSQSATTRLVTRLEERGLLSRFLCPDDRRGIYTNVTPDGLALLVEARPTHDGALREALKDAAQRPELAPLVTAFETLAPPE